MLFDCTALAIGLYASVIARWRPNERFSYGYGRVELLSGFANGVFLVLVWWLFNIKEIWCGLFMSVCCFFEQVSVFVLWESMERFFEPPEVNTDRLLLVSVLGLLVNMLGIWAFQVILLIYCFFFVNSKL